MLQRSKDIEFQKPKNQSLDVKDLLAQFDLDAIGKSTIKYYQSIIDLSNALLDHFQELENISPDNESMQKLKLTPEDLRGQIKDVRNQIENLKSHADQFFIQLNEVNHSTNLIQKLAELESMPRPSFEFIVENIAKIVDDMKNEMKYFIENHELIAQFIEYWKVWSGDFTSFKTNSRNELLKSCRNDGIDDEVSSKWFDEWNSRRLTIEKMFFPIVKFAFDGKSEIAAQSIQVLQNYKFALNNLYQKDRASIYRKFAFQAGGDLQEKFELETQMMNLSENFQRELQSVIFSSDSAEDRMFLLRWAESIINLPVDAVIAFVDERKLDKISEEILSKFSELRQQNFANYIADAKSYSEDLKRREDEFNALMFRMRKDLM